MKRRRLCFGLLTLLFLVFVFAGAFGAVRFAYDHGYAEGKDLHEVVTIRYPVNDLIVTKAGKGDYEAAMELLKGRIAPASWHGGGPGWVHPHEDGSLVITQTKGNHREIEMLLAELRKDQRQ